jgi:DNA-binding NtrC family response regulator
VSETGTTPRSERRIPLKGVRVDIVHSPHVVRGSVADAERVRVGSADGNDLVLFGDRRVSRYHLSLERRGGWIAVIDHESTNGTVIGPATLRGSHALVAPGTELRVGDTTLRVSDGRVTTVDPPRGGAFGGLVGRSEVMQRLMAQAMRVAPSEASVLIAGESGTGKELLARALHDHGPRASHPFVVVDCGALPPSVFAAELFGHEPGAFTGAQGLRRGALERASRGTLFLDEVGELPLSAQAALLGCLERRRFVRLGGNTEIGVDFRIVAATNRDLQAEVNRGTFRLDLFYRLAVVQLAMPPLREHSEDLDLLIEHFLAEMGHSGGVADLFTAQALEEMGAYGWPGNVRELRNAIASTVATGSEPSFDAPAPQGRIAEPFDALLDQGYKEARNQLLREFERRYLERLLQRSDGSVRRAAREARMDRSYLTELLKRHGLR